MLIRSGAIDTIAVGAIDFVFVAIAEVFVAGAALLVIAFYTIPVSAIPFVLDVYDHLFAGGTGEKFAAVCMAALAARISAVLTDRVIGVAETRQLARSVFKSAAGGLMTAVGAIAPAQTTHSAVGMHIAPLTGVELTAAAVFRIAAVLRIALTFSVLMFLFAVLADDFAVVPSAVATVMAFNAAAVEGMLGARLAETTVAMRAGQMRSFDVARIALAHAAAVAALVVQGAKLFVTLVKLAAGALIVYAVTDVMAILATIALVVLKAHGIAVGVLAAAHEAMVGHLAVVGTEVQAAGFASYMLADAGIPQTGTAAFADGMVEVGRYAHGQATGLAVVAVLGVVSFRIAQQYTAVGALSDMLVIVRAAVAFGLAISGVVVIAVAAIVAAVLYKMRVFRLGGFAAGGAVGANSNHKGIADCTVFFGSNFDAVDMSGLIAFRHRNGRGADSLRGADCVIGGRTN